MSPELSSRRTACNRCKTQKLRCIRATEDTHSDICRRCLKAGTTCVTSASSTGISTPSSSRADVIRQRQRQQQSPRRERVEPLTASLTRQDRESETQVLTPTSTMAETQAESCYNLHDGSDYQETSTLPSDNSMRTPTAMTAIEKEILSRYHSNTSTNHSSLDILDPSLIPSLPPPLDTREECVRKLAGLHSSLVLDLNTVRGCQTADKCTKIIHMPEFSQTYNFPIGRMLGASAKFIEILQYFVASEQNRGELLQHQPKETIHCDVPTLFSIFTCYTYLIRIYRVIFTSIYKSVTGRADASQKLPPLFPGLHLGGYSLEPHLDVQVNILVQTGESMLAKIDDAMGLSSDGRTGLLSRVEGSVDFLRSMIEREMGEDYTEEVLVGDDKASLREIIASLKKACSA